MKQRRSLWSVLAIVIMLAVTFLPIMAVQGHYENTGVIYNCYSYHGYANYIGGPGSRLVQVFVDGDGSGPEGYAFSTEFTFYAVAQKNNFWTEDGNLPVNRYVKFVMYLDEDRDGQPDQDRYGRTKDPVDTDVLTIQQSYTCTNTPTSTPTSTWTPSNTPTWTPSFTPSNTLTFTPTWTNTASPTNTTVPSDTPTATQTNTEQPTSTPTHTEKQPTFTPTWTPTFPPPDPEWIECQQYGKHWGGLSYSVGSHSGVIEDFGGVWGKLSVLFDKKTEAGKTYDLYINGSFVGQWVIPNEWSAGTSNWCMAPNSGPTQLPPVCTSDNILVLQTMTEVIVVTECDPSLVVIINNVLTHQDDHFIGMYRVTVGWNDVVEIWINGSLYTTFYGHH